MFKVEKYPHGTFSWIDCNSTDTATAKPFYTELMGWDYDDMPVGEGVFYTMFKHNGESVAALSPMPPYMVEQGVPSHWNSYISVDDVDAMVEKVKTHGGTVITEPFDVFDSGRMMVMQDPTGATVCLWQAGTHIGSGLANTPGAFTWNELATPDPQAAIKFYGDLFGWRVQKEEDVDYYVIMNGDRPNGGMFLMPEQMGGMPPAWSVLLSVADIAATMEKAKELGGTVLMGPIEAGENGTFAVIQDPVGAVFNAIQLTNPQPWTE
ncbi:MAG: VOC family protein [Chloroflexota bacterium]